MRTPAWDRLLGRRGRGPVVIAAVVAALGAVGVLALTADPTTGPEQLRWSPATDGTAFAAPAPARPTTTRAEAGTTSVASGSLPTTTSTASVPAEMSPAAGPAPGTGGGWRRLALSDPQLTGALEDVVSVDTGGERALVSAGTDGERPLVLFSFDGERWDRLTQRGLEGGGRARAVAADAERVVAVGRDDAGPAAWELRGDAAWERLVVEGAGEADAVLSSVAVLGDRTVVVGFDAEGSGIWAAAGPTGALERVPVAAVESAVAGETVVRDVVVAEDRLVAVGRAGEVPVRWSSSDGARWRAVPLEDPDGGGTPVALGADGTVIGGYDAVGGVVWRVEAGRQRRWRVPEPTDRPQTVEALAVSGASVVLLGRDGRAPRCWTGTLSVDAEAGPAACAGATGIPPGALLRGMAWRGTSLVAVGAHRDTAARPGIWIRSVEPRGDG